MTQKHPHYADEEAFEAVRYNYLVEQSRWSFARYAGSMTVVGGFLFALLPLASNLISLQVPAHVAAPVVAIGITVAAISFAVAAFSNHVIKARQLDTYVYEPRTQDINDRAYRFVVHYMKHIGVPDAEERLSSNVLYLDQSREVIIAVNDIESLTDPSLVYQPPTPNAHRIASLVLRDEESLALAPHLIDLIKQRALTDYDALAELLDNTNEHHSSMSSGIL